MSNKIVLLMAFLIICMILLISSIIELNHQKKRVEFWKEAGKEYQECIDNWKETVYYPQLEEMKRTNSSWMINPSRCTYRGKRT